MNRLNRRNGSILIMTAIMAVFLFTMIALVVDLAVAYNSQKQHADIARMVAVSSLNAFLGEFDAGDPVNTAQAAIDAATARAAGIAGVNFTVTHTGPEISHDIRADATGSNAGSPGENGKITFGKWWFRCDEDPDCNGTNSNGSPVCPNSVDCFTPVNPFAESAQAIRVQLALDNSGPMITMRFAGVLGYRELDSNVQATSANVPLRGAFLVDSSGSTQYQTHPNGGNFFGNRLERPLFSYRLTENPQAQPGEPPLAACPAGFVCDCTNLAGNFLGQGSQPCGADGETGCWYNFAEKSGGHMRSFYGAPCPSSFVDDPTQHWLNLSGCEESPNPQHPTLPPPDTRGAPSGIGTGTVTNPLDGNVYLTDGLPDSRGLNRLPPQKHYRDDYRCYRVTFTEDQGLDGDFTNDPLITESYLVDTYQYLTPIGAELNPEFYTGPQPLSSIWNSLYYSAQEFERRGVNGDGMIVAFYDEHVSIRERIFPMPDSLFDIGLMNPRASDPEFQRFKDTVNIMDAPPLPYPQGVVQSMLFPRLAGGKLNARTAFTNTPEALTAALIALDQAPGSDGANNFVVLISDGFTNCDFDNGSVPPCANDGAHWFNSFYLGVYGGAAIPFRDQHIPIHVLLVGGDHVHTLNIGVNGVPLTDREARSEGLPYVYLGDFSGDGNPNPENVEIMAAYDNSRRSTTHPAYVPFFHAAFAWYNVARLTNGFFWPLRPIDPTINPAAPPALPPNAGAWGLWTGLPPAAQVAATFIPDTALPAPNPGSPGAFEYHTWVANAGPGVIQRYDTQGRVFQKQIQDAIEELFRFPTIILVDD